jgi:hypothetical protein
VFLAVVNEQMMIIDMSVTNSTGYATLPNAVIPSGTECCSVAPS